MQIKVKLFGGLTDVVGKGEVFVDYFEESLQFLSALYLAFPGLKNQPFILTINQEPMTEGQRIEPGDEIVLVPPFSGG